MASVRYKCAPSTVVFQLLFPLEIVLLDCGRFLSVLVAFFCLLQGEKKNPVLGSQSTTPLVQTTFYSAYLLSCAYHLRLAEGQLLALIVPLGQTSQLDIS